MEWDTVDWTKFLRHMAVLAVVMYAFCLVAVQAERKKWEDNLIEERPLYERRGGLVPLSDLGGRSLRPGQTSEPH